MKASKLNTLLGIVSFIAILGSCQQQTGSNTYKVVYRNGEDGNGLYGSRQDLIQQIRGGADIKVGWGSKGKTRSIEHLAEPIWISVLNEDHVRVLLEPHYVTSSDTSEVNQEWRVTMSTRGEFDALWYDKYIGEAVRIVPQRHPMTWYARGKSEHEAPLYLEE